ncbi:TlpA family protein disulfide reductase [Aestuariivivens marinum]|uniref:TlpA family protein disulfide reductase n=1 Tax=Aestuariivivens marinum TaxID=2913555 RepID=UPI001F56839A|nr:TlpA disulfide reductase family protein [Aestuariivivens marinum]
MQKTLILSGLLILAMGCKKQTPIDYAVLSGKISNYEGGVLTINSMDRKLTDTINVSEDGTFKDTLRLAPSNYMLYDGKNPTLIHLNTGNDFTVNYDAKDYKNSLNITGVGAEITNYLHDKRNIEQKLQGEGNFYLLEADEYKQTANTIKDSLTAYIGSLEGISEDYKALEKRNINYAYLATLNKYKPYHSYYAKKQDVEVSESFLSELDDINYNNEEDFNFSENYKGLVTAHYRDEASKLAESDSIKQDIAFLKTVANIESETIKNNLLFQLAQNGITYTSDLQAFYDLFMANSTNEADKEKITESYNKLKAVAKGSPSPKFMDYENYAGGTTSLDDLKGKYVYIDVWATWCGPCKAEIPFLKEVEEKYHGKNIEFVSISIDRARDHEKWKAMVADKELKGIQLFADNDWSSKFVKDYLIQGIPRFILIDTEGNIINANAPRPSSPELINLFDEYKI